MSSSTELEKLIKRYGWKEITNDMEWLKRLETNENQSEITLEQLIKYVSENPPNDPIKMKVVLKIDNELMESLSDWIYDELKYMRKNESEIVDEDIQEFLEKDSHEEYSKLSPLMHQLYKIFRTIEQGYT